ncbi:hypothetical protein CWI80_02970 [Pseudidiomarina sediminum]|uniref:Type II secretion system protein n=2 Tax=Pseudidiomarina sediminum TaxID=431675 RepID=A0A432Z8Y5_9GAMM|nr:hypothetical protein CWI80_02970 [Pseudidiomarina sediminum]
MGQLIMRQPKGYILFELVLGLSLLSLILLSTQQWFLYQRTQQQRQLDVTQAKVFLTAVERFWLQEQRPPAVVSELISKGYLEELWYPWQGAQWQLSEHDQLLRLSLPAEEVEVAQWLTGRIAGAMVNEDGFLQLHVWKPIALVLQHRYLQRFTDPQAPEVNTMQSDLLMDGNAIRNVGTIDAEQVSAPVAIIQQGTFQSLNANQLMVTQLIAEHAQVDGYSVAEMAQRLAQLQQQWQQFQAQGGCQ